MQAQPNHTASGEHSTSALPPSLSPTVLSELPAWIGTTTPYAGPGAQPIAQRSSRGEDRVAEGIGLAHDAGNLLGAIRLYCDLLALPGVLRSEHRHYAEELRQLSARSGSLIGRFLQTESHANGHPAAAPETMQGPENGVGTIALPEAVAVCRGLLQTIVGAGSLLVSVEASADARVAVSREAVERILVNLAKNAVEAGGADHRGPITVRVRSVPGWGGGLADGVALAVEDCGRGMSEAAMRAVLAGEPPPSLRTSAGGRGIGLRVVRELVAGTGGELRLRSRIGRGTTVEAIWPAPAVEGSESG